MKQTCLWIENDLPMPVHNFDKTTCKNTGLILGLCSASERRRYKVAPSVIGWAQA